MGLLIFFFCLCLLSSWARRPEHCNDDFISDWVA